MAIPTVIIQKKAIHDCITIPAAMDPIIVRIPDTNTMAPIVLDNHGFIFTGAFVLDIIFISLPHDFLGLLSGT